jgi:mannose-6-phosphate isomerase
MTKTRLFPLRFEPILQYRLWGGENLPGFLHVAGDNGPFGEAWILSDRKDCASCVADGPLKGTTLSQLLELYPEEMLGGLAGRFDRFPLLLKFLDVRKMLSVQVHPADHQTNLLPEGESGKTEAWVVLEADPDSRIYAGLRPGVGENELRKLSLKTVDACLSSFSPRAGDAVLVEAGTVHSLGGGLLVFEVQENSDVTFRLYDWDHIDPKTGRARPLQVEQALACINLDQGTVGRIELVKDGAREQLFDSRYFRVWRNHGRSPCSVGAAGELRILVCLEGSGMLRHDSGGCPVGSGDVFMLPAAVGACHFEPGGAANLLEIAIPEGA